MIQIGKKATERIEAAVTKATATVTAAAKIDEGGNARRSVGRRNAGGSGSGSAAGGRGGGVRGTTTATVLSPTPTLTPTPKTTAVAVKIHPAAAAGGNGGAVIAGEAGSTGAGQETGVAGGIVIAMTIATSRQSFPPMIHAAASGGGGITVTKKIVGAEKVGGGTILAPAPAPAPAPPFGQDRRRGTHLCLVRARHLPTGSGADGLRVKRRTARNAPIATIGYLAVGVAGAGPSRNDIERFGSTEKSATQRYFSGPFPWIDRRINRPRKATLIFV